MTDGWMRIKLPFLVRRLRPANGRFRLRLNLAVEAAAGRAGRSRPAAELG